MPDYRDVDIEEFRHLVSDRALRGETMLLNMGPQHPSTHGVLRLLLELDGEIIINCIPDIGFLHTGIEKTMESKIYQKAEVLTDRIDYMNNAGNNLVFCLALEKLIELDVPPRAQAIRVILAELTRLSDYMLWLGTSALDLGAMSVYFFTMQDRERIMDIMEMCSGQRMMTTFIRPGGVWRDVPAEFEDTLRGFLKDMPGRIDKYEALLTKNPIFLDRTRNVGVITTEQCLEWGISGPILRATGMAYDVRKVRPYSGYEQYDFEVPTADSGDIFGRYMVRMQEFRQTLRIIQQALDTMPAGRVRSQNRKFVPPPRSEIGVSMEALIHHFKLWTDGFPAPSGAVYVGTESPHGELGVFMEGDGSHKGRRIHFNTPSFANLQVMALMAKGHFVGDLVGIIASTDIVLGDVDR